MFMFVMQVLYVNVQDGSSSAKPLLFLHVLFYYKRHFVLFPFLEFISWIFYFSTNACVLCLVGSFYAPFCREQEEIACAGHGILSR